MSYSQSTVQQQSQKKSHRVILASVSALFGVMVGHLVSPYLDVWIPAEKLPFYDVLYRDTSDLVVTQEGVGGQRRVVEVRTPDRVRPGHTMVLWVANADKNGVPDYGSVYPYRTIEAHAQDRATVQIGGGKRSGDVGNVFVVQVCDVGGNSLERVKSYFSAIRLQTPAEDKMRNDGISIKDVSGDFSCSQGGTKIVQRTIS